MNITLDQAQALEAISSLGTVQAAAKYLNKGHSAILYSIRTLEEQTGLTLFDRQDYRNRLNPNGEVVLKYCRELLQTKRVLESVCNRLKGGWEAQIQLIYDGVVDFKIIAEGLKVLSREAIPTDLRIQAAYLEAVEREFIQKKADIMITILPIHLPGIESLKLNPFDMHLVAEKNHPLSQCKTKKGLSTGDLMEFPFVMVKETANNLGLSTERLEFHSSITVNDFPTKREAILRGLGFGWLPDYLIQSELKRGDLRIVKTQIANQHRLTPRLYHNKKELLGRGTELLLKHYVASTKT